MSSIVDADALLAPLLDADPCGPDLEYDPMFMGLERLAQGKPEQKIGDSVIPAEDPEWRRVKSDAMELLGRSKDLRLAIYLTKALLNVDGLPGLVDGLSLTTEMVGRYWDQVHPRLDATDGNDPTIRVNALYALCDERDVLRPLRALPLLTSTRVGRFALRDVAPDGQSGVNANGEPGNTSAVDAAVMDVDVGALQGTHDLLTRAHQLARGLESLLTEKVGAGHSVDFGPLLDVLHEACKVVNGWLLRRGVGRPPVADSAGEDVAPAHNAAEPALAGVIKSRDDVRRALDRVCEYYSNYEPSSPVPILLRQVGALVGKDFLDILQDLAPDCVPQIKLMRPTQ